MPRPWAWVCGESQGEGREGLPFVLFFVDIINLQQWVQNIRLWFMESRPLQLKKAHDGSMSQGCVDVRLPTSCLALKQLYAENLSFIFCFCFHHGKPQYLWCIYLSSLWTRIRSGLSHTMALQAVYNVVNSSFDEQSRGAYWRRVVNVPSGSIRLFWLWQSCKETLSLFGIVGAWQRVSHVHLVN